MKKIMVNKDLCIKCGACVAMDPEHFDFDEEGRSNVINNDNLESNNLVNAIESCPTNAISMINEECNCDHNSNNDHEKCNCQHNNCPHENR